MSVSTDKSEQYAYLAITRTVEGVGGRGRLDLEIVHALGLGFQTEPLN